MHNSAVFLRPIDQTGKPDWNGRHRSRTASSRISLISLGVLVLAVLAPGSWQRYAMADATASLPAVNVVAAPGPTKPGYSKLVDNTAVLQPVLARASGPSTVFVQLRTAGAAAVADAGLARNLPPAAIRRAVIVHRSGIAALSTEISAAARALDPAARTIFEVGNAVPGVGLVADSTALRALADRPDVVSVSAIIPKIPANAGAAALTGVVQSWHDLGATGRGVRIGVIDTGIDDTHADFGGVGTPGAYAAARLRSAQAWVPTAKVVGGHDFVGDRYDAAAADPVSGLRNPAYQPVPHPDANPLDCNGHGTHVAGTIAGSGVDGAGRTMTGDYSKLSAAALYDLQVAPGMAPEASLYALKVFGCTGATDAVIPALDWALDPNGDGDFSDRLDVVDLSLTSSSSAAIDPETVVLDTIARYGVLPVVAVGNGGDQVDAASSLAGSTRALAVASSVDAYRQLDGLRAEPPGRPAFTVAGQASLAYDWAASSDVRGKLVSLSSANADGCSPLSPQDAARVAGKVAWLEWDDDDATRQCGSAPRSANVRSAGAVGAVLTSSSPVFRGMITGDSALPVLQLTPAATATLRPELDSGLEVVLSASMLGKKPEIDDSIADLIGSWSARGPHSAPGLVKPDVSAPGDTIASARMGSGTGSSVRSGTSMAAAEVAGIAALVRQRQPSWSPEQVKAAVIDTAGHDLYASAGHSGPALGPNRVGSGRIDARAALATAVLAFSSTDPGSVSASLGVVPADVRRSSVVATSAVVVQNTSAADADLRLSYQSLVDEPGVEYQVTPTTMHLPAGSSALATVTMTIRPSQLRHTLDPATPVQQANTLTGLDEARQYVSAASGRVVLTSPDAPDLRVPVYGAATPISSTSAADGTVAGRPAIVLSGTGFSLSAPGEPASTGESSLASVLELGYRSPPVPACSAGSAVAAAPEPRVAAQNLSRDSGRSTCSIHAGAPGDIQAVGAGRTAVTDIDPGYLWFGVSTHANWATVGKNLFPTVDIDTNGDRIADFTVQVQTVGGNSDLLYAMLFDDHGSGSLVSIYPVNFNSGEVNTNVFDTNVMLIPVDPRAIGFQPADATFPVTYSVSISSTSAGVRNAGTVDSTPGVDFDVARPRIITVAPLWQDKGGTGIPYQLAPGRRTADALVLHLFGADGAREQIIRLAGRTH